jgi:hypothetical protein
VEVEIKPEPEEREPLVAAVEALLARDSCRSGYRSAWRERGIRENLEDAALQGETGRPRSSPGATRA